MKKKNQIDTRMQGKLIRDPDNPFAAWDEEGRPCLPTVLDDDSPSHGTPGGPFGIFSPDGSRSVPASRRSTRHPSCSSATRRKLMVYCFNWT